MAAANPSLAKDVAKKRASRSEADYVTYCAMCRNALASSGKRVLHILDLFFTGSEPSPSTRKALGHLGVLVVLAVDELTNVRQNLRPFGCGAHQRIAVIRKRQRYQPAARDPTLHLAEDEPIFQEATRGRRGKHDWIVSVRLLQGRQPPARMKHAGSLMLEQGLIPT